MVMLCSAQHTNNSPYWIFAAKLCYSFIYGICIVLQAHMLVCVFFPPSFSLSSQHHAHVFVPLMYKCMMNHMKNACVHMVGSSSRVPIVVCTHSTQDKCNKHDVLLV